MNQVRFVWPPVTKSVIAIGIILFLFWFGSIMIPPVGQLRDEYLLLSGPALREHYAVWSLFTHAWFEPDFVAVLFTAVTVWLFGGEIEGTSGTRHFWKLVIAAILLSGLVVAAAQFLVPQAYSGWRAPSMALIAAYSWRHWTRPLNLFMFPMNGKILFLILFLFSAGFAAVAGMWLSVVANVVGAGIGFLLSRTGGGGWRDIKTRIRLWNARRKLKLVKTRRPPLQRRGQEVHELGTRCAS